MNTFVPDLHAHATFTFAVAVMVLSAVVLWLLFKRARWL
jgi:Mg2+ and Co2+ transporter CorA